MRGKYFVKEVFLCASLLLCRYDAVCICRCESAYDYITQFDGKVPVIIELWGMQRTSSLVLHPGSLWSSVVAPDRVLSMSQIELFEI